ncbi:MAG TPA: FixH family protein [Leptospiraceae bacterium]|nr:FixH family protein [Leptospiraceae bacterium]HMY65307.1 FixH family protein [Leptospiraceae bacterium]HMZ60415.1 FixH family protein [Leptospiraceae bacterium]HNF16642.1 FixH family protein [Leptospiraceae bacterium]HNF27314.1 FixH family protein [Leptospiraceae bacterium]
MMATNLHPSVKRAFILIGLLFLGLFAATAVTVKVAYSQESGLIDKNYYEIGLEYENFLRKKIQETKK